MTDASADDLENWQPPDDWSSRDVLREALADRRAGRYAAALAKHVWFHQNELSNAVRLSFALTDWRELANVYPPALQKLKEFRDQAKDNLLNGNNVTHSFSDFERINRKLDEAQLSVELFLWLDKHRPELARKCYIYAESPLIRAGEYQVCGKYIDPEHTLEIQLMSWDIMRKQPSHTNLPQKLNQKSRLDFRNHGVLSLGMCQQFAVLIALLIHNDHSPEARAFAGRVRYEFNDQVLNELVAEALEGQFPPGY